jgi:Protein of unknown function (DUF2997)
LIQDVPNMSQMQVRKTASNKRVAQMETLEFIIYADGRVQEKVTGITGSSCAEVTAAIEAKLGRVLNQETTSEYFAQVLQQSASATTQNYSEW